MWRAELHGGVNTGSESSGSGNAAAAQSAESEAAARQKQQERTRAGHARTFVRKRPAAAPVDKVPNEIRDTFKKGHDADSPAFGYFPLGPFITRLIHRVSSTDNSLDDPNAGGKLSRLWEWVMTRRLAASLTVAASVTKSRIEDVVKYIGRLASLVIHHDHTARRHIEWNAKRCESRRTLIYCDNNSEDETPMALAVIQQLELPQDFVAELAKADRTTDLALQSADLPMWRIGKARSRAVAKLVQSDNGYSLLQTNPD